MAVVSKLYIEGSRYAPGHSRQALRIVGTLRQTGTHV